MDERLTVAQPLSSFSSGSNAI